MPSSFQAYDPHPIVVRHAAGSRMVDVDGNEYVDYDMGFGALFAGHMNPAVARAVAGPARRRDALRHAVRARTPRSPSCSRDRYGLPMWRFTNSGTEATMDAIRVAKGATGRDKIVKVEGGYHGHHDEVMISMKPPLDQAGPADAPISVPGTAGITQAHRSPTPSSSRTTIPTPSIGCWRAGDVACFIVEPVMENIGICLPQPGYLEAVREITTRHGTLLIFDEVKTGITAGYGGATGHFGVQPDLVTLAKSIGGGFPVGAFGGRQELHGPHHGRPRCSTSARTTATRW